MTPASAPYTPGSSGFLSWPRRAEAWLDARGRGAWIIAMVVGFIAFWPVGLALVAYITYTNRWSKEMFGKSCRHDRTARWGGHRMNTSSGNAAFDAYKSDVLRRLEDEQTAFETFLQRLRDAKDKQEFDAFMEDRARVAQTPAATETPRVGDY